MRLDLPVLLSLTVASATLQTALPAASWLAMKPPLLTAVAAYYALSREVSLAMTAALWIGALTDVCSGFPFPLTTVWLLVLCGMIRYVRRSFSGDTFWRGMAIMAIAAPVQTLWYAVAVGGIRWNDCVQGLAPAAAVGAAAGWAVFAVCGWLDGLAGNVKGTKPDDGASWHTANV